MPDRYRTRGAPYPVRRLLLVVGAAVALLLTLVAGQISTREIGPGDLTLLGASGCTLRDGPAQFQENCIAVDGEGLFVRDIQSYVQAFSAPGYPGTVCALSVEITGTLADRSPYRVAGSTAPGCSLISRGMTATVNQEFLPQSQICARTFWGNWGWSPPACVQVRPS